MSISRLTLYGLKPEPNVPDLIFMLQHPDCWPKDFVWDYTDIHGCGIMLAQVAWPDRKYDLAPALAMRSIDYDHIFFYLTAGWLFKTRAKVKPRHVAEALINYQKQLVTANP